MDTRRERLKESLLILEGLSPAQRRAWIAERLADDPELAREATRLLEIDADVDSRLTPLIAPPEALAVAGMLPRQIGPFVVDGLIAQGGMGSVYRAHQIVPVKRRAAVKVLRAEFSSKQLLDRFEDERQAIAKMEHRNVARLLDAGIDADGRSYIAMELVDGPPITEYAVLHNLSLRQRLEIFVQVCRGVQHAHNRGILHRDLKPSNILVTDEDAQPVPKVIDFGVAKLFTRDGTPSKTSAGHTLAGQLIGTLGYMSPEQTDQLHPDADVRSDTYSLGVVLYELLTGTLPVPTDALSTLSVGDVRAAISNHPRIAPSRLKDSASANRRTRGGVPAELDCLILKASHPDPSQRYASPSELAADIERYLSGRPITASPPSTWYHARKFVQRHRAAVISATLVLLAILAGLTAAGVGFRRALLDRQAAEEALVAAEAQRVRADQALARTEEVSAYLRELLMRAHPAKLGPKATFEQILRAAATDFLAKPPANLLVRAEVASAIGEPLYLVGDYDTVEKLLAPEVDALASADLPRARELRASIMLRLGYVASRRSRPGEAETRFTQAAELAKATDSPQLIFQASGAVAQTFTAAGKYDEAIAMLHAMLDSEIGKRDEMLRASALSNLGTAYGRKGAFATGLPYSRQGYEIRARLAPRDPNTHNMGWQLGISFMENGQLDEAVRIFEQTYAASAEASGADHADVVAGVIMLNYARARRGDGAGVIAPMRAAIDRQKALGIPLRQVSQSRIYLAGAMMYAGQRAEAITEADATFADLTAASTPCDRGVVAVLLQAGTMFSIASAAQESLPYLERAYACSKSEPDVAPLAPRIAGAIGWSYKRMNDEANAEKWFQTERDLRGPK